MLYNRCNNHSMVAQGLNDYYTEIEEPEEIQETDFGDYGDYIENPFWMTYYKGHDGFYYDSSNDEYEQYPVSASLASAYDGLLRDDWGTTISVVNEWYGLRYCKSYLEADIIQKQYESAIGRTSTYRGNVAGHVLNRFGIVWEPIKHNYLVGQERFGVFCISHFAPSSIRKGMEMMKSVLHHNMPVCIATLPYQANMLRKIGFKEVGYAPQWFNGEIHQKTVMVNDAVDVYTVKSLLDTIGEYIN